MKEKKFDNNYGRRPNFALIMLFVLQLIDRMPWD